MPDKIAIANLHPLQNADGSATYVSPSRNHVIIAGVNYPVEVPYRSDEIPESTFIDVNLRPHNGVGMVKERHIEELVRRTLQAVVLRHETPRTMLQITLQVADVEIDENLPGGVKGGGQGESYLDILTGAINSAILGCLDAGVQMKGLAGAALVGVLENGAVTAWPSVTEKRQCRSMHALAYSNQGDCLLMESEGHFDLGHWTAAERIARIRVLEDSLGESDNDNIKMQQEDQATIFALMRKSVETRVAYNERWRYG